MRRLPMLSKEAERMGRAGRRRVEQLMSLDRYVERLRGQVAAVEEAAVRADSP